MEAKASFLISLETLNTKEFFSMIKKVVKYSRSRALRSDEIFLNEIPSYQLREGWIKSENYLPENYALVFLKKDIVSPPLSGWIIGKKWFGLRVKECSYKYWKFAKGEKKWE